MRRPERILPLVICLAFFATDLLAQNATQQISGFVRDASGGAVAGATVTVRQIGTQMERTAKTSGTGYYVIVSIPIGVYEATVENVGFKRFVKTNVQVTVNSKPTVNATLDVGTQQETVTVVAEAAMVESNTGEIGRLITGEQVSNLQLDGRNFAQLALLMPGVAFHLTSTGDLLGAYGSQQGVFIVNGGKRGMQSWNLDGADNRDSGGPGNNFINISPDALAEFKMMTSNYSAEYGQNAGAVVNMVIKSGSNNFHGSAHEYMRHESLHARPSNAKTKPRDRQHNFGATLGGPLVIPGLIGKDKLFFFTSLDFKRIDTRTSVNTWTVPTQDERNGILSTETVPAAQMNANAKRLIALYPMPNAFNAAGTKYSQYVFTGLLTKTLNQALIKLDYNINSHHQLSGHYARDYYSAEQNQTNLMVYDRNIPGESVAVKWTWITSPTLVNTFQVTTGMNRIQQVNFRPNPDLGVTDTTRAGLGIDYPLVYGVTQSVPTMSISGYTTLNVSPGAWQNFNRITQIKDDLSKIMSRHNLKVGFLLVHSAKNQDNQPAALNGNVNFSSFANALRGNFNTYSEAARAREGWFAFNSAEAYVQDNWKVTARLSLDLGLRCYYMQPTYSRLNNAVTFQPRFFDPAKAPTLSQANGAIVSAPGTYDVTNGLAVGGSSYPEVFQIRFPDYNKAPYSRLFKGLRDKILPDERKIAPRFSFAYDLSGKQSTILRGGFGTFYERIQGNVIFDLINNPPMVQDTTINGSNTTSIDNILSGKTAAAQVQNVNLSFSDELELPTVQNWSLGIQQKLDKATVLDVAYVGSRGYHQTRRTNLNVLPVGTKTPTKNAKINTNALRPYQGYSDIIEIVTDGTFNYHGLQALLRRRFGRSGMLQVAYTYSKSLTDGSDWNYLPVYSLDPKMDRGPADASRTHILVASYVIPIPIFRNEDKLIGKLLGGWQLSGVTTVQSGRPLNITVDGDPAGIGTSGGQRPQVVGDWRVAADERTTAKVFNTAAFAVPEPGTFGNLTRNRIPGPSYYNWDMSLRKTFVLKKGVTLQYRFEAFNVFNHANWLGVGTTVGSSTFGQVTSFTDPRRIQMAFRLAF